MLTCICCERHLPRDAIAFIRKTPMQAGKFKGRPCAVCGECYAPGGRFWGFDEEPDVPSDAYEFGSYKAKGSR